MYYKDINVTEADIHVGYDTEETDYLYTNQEFDDESGLMYYNARYYNPITGRFLSRDSYMGEIGDTLSRSRYAYVKNNPYKYTDPTGYVALDHTAQQISNNFDAGIGALVYMRGLAKEQYATWTGNEELLEEAWGDIISGYEQNESAIIDMGNEQIDYLDKDWGERANDDINFVGDVIEETFVQTYNLAEDIKSVVTGSSGNTGPTISEEHKEPSITTGSIVVDLMEEENKKLAEQTVTAIGVLTGAKAVGELAEAGYKYGVKNWDSIVDSGKKLFGKNVDVIYNTKISGQMPTRGWNKSSVESTIKSPTHTSPATNKANGNPATAYYDSKGNYVVRDDVTNDIVQVSDKNKPDWAPDDSIVNPMKK